MILANMARAELEETLARFKKVLGVTLQEYQQKYVQFQDLSRELTALGDSVKNLKGSVATIERALGLSSESEQIALPANDQLVPLEEVDKVRVGKMDASEAAMRIVASQNDSGGITFNEIFHALNGQGYKVSREYMHTILNRKKNYQKKIEKRGDKWFLTEKGKEELGLK